MLKKPDFRSFEKLCQEGNLIPVCAEVLADLETPVSVLARFADDPEVFLLESVEGSERFGRYSFIGVNPRGVFSVENNRPYFTENGVKRELPFDKSPFTALRSVLGNIRPASVPGVPPLFGGAIGYIGYETVNEFEELPGPKKPLETPTALFLVTDEMRGQTPDSPRPARTRKSRTTSASQGKHDARRILRNGREGAEIHP